MKTRHACISSLAILALFAPAACDDPELVVDENLLLSDDPEAVELALADEQALADELTPEELDELAAAEEAAAGRPGAQGLTLTTEEDEPLAAYTVRDLTMGTATFSQTSSFDLNVDKAIDALTWEPTSGWAIYNPALSPDTTVSQQAAFELFDAHSGDTPTGRTRVRFQMRFGYGDQHHLGSFHLYVTNSAKTTFADGANNNGQVIGTATWTKVDVTSVTSAAAFGTKPTMLSTSGNHVYASNCGSGADDVTITVVGEVPIDRITGVRILAQDNDNYPSLPGGGPGCQPTNGNFHMTDFRFHTEPIEP